MLQQFKADLFRSLGHPVRIRIFELLRTSATGELTVSELQEQLGIEASSVSQQLALLRARGLVVGRKENTRVYYRVADERVFELLDVARAIFESQLSAMQEMAEATPEGVALA
ncbi:MAG: winged helix-turn-helix transcriptional regulator [Thermomicrobiales bacterium]|nr:winged helix-turn-helix transcriptional regulator [Thermomicrobiales bacterium]